MARSEKRVAAKQRVNASVTHLSIEEQTAAFLKSGGKIQQIPTGVSGQTNLAGPKHITLGKKTAEASDATSVAANRK